MSDVVEAIRVSKRFGRCRDWMKSQLFKALHCVGVAWGYMIDARMNSHSLINDYCCTRCTILRLTPHHTSPLYSSQFTTSTLTITMATTKYPAKEHARRVAEKIKENVPNARGIIYLEGQKTVLIEDNDEPVPFRCVQLARPEYIMMLTWQSTPALLLPHWMRGAGLRGHLRHCLCPLDTLHPSAPPIRRHLVRTSSWRRRGPRTL